MIPQSEWKWYGHAGHLIVASRCRFHLCTEVGPYLISTVGDYYPDGDRGKRETIGAGDDAFFETFVFRIYQPRHTKCDAACGQCNMPEVDFSEIDGERRATAGEAARLHMAMCHKYATADAARNPSGGAPDEHGGNDDETHLVDGAPGGDAAGAGDCGDGAGALPRGGVPNG